MDNFEKIWENIENPFNGELVSSELRPLIKNVHQQITKPSPALSEIKASLENLFIYLSSSAGRTSANCYATDLFSILADWSANRDIYPEELKGILWDIGGALHDTISHPEVAKNFESLPEQLLERIHKWDVNVEHQ